MQELALITKLAKPSLEIKANFLFKNLPVDFDLQFGFTKSVPIEFSKGFFTIFGILKLDEAESILLLNVDLARAKLFAEVDDLPVEDTVNLFD